MENNPIYVSKPHAKSLWNEYRIYKDRIELQSRQLFLKFVVPFDELHTINVYKPPVIKTTFWALKIDLADLYEHVGIKREKGWFKKIRFIPKNPKEFVSKVKECLKIKS